MSRRRGGDADAWGRVTGGTQFVADVPAEAALHAAFTLSTVAHGRILAVDVSEALALPGVVDAITGRDLDVPRLGRALRDYPVLATDRVLFIGQRVAAVVAADADTARDAAQLVTVEYQELDVIADARDAFTRHEDVLHPDYCSYSGALRDRPGPGAQGTASSSVGDAAAFGACDRVFDESFLIGRSHSAPLEPHACLVVAGPTVQVFSTHKEPFQLRRDLALVSGRHVEDIVVHARPIGGDFGAKGFPFIEAACYFLSLRVGRPVRSTMTYYEELTSTAARHPTAIRLRTGLRDGRLHAHSVEALLDGGAFAALKALPSLVIPVVGASMAPYGIANRTEQCSSIYTNSLPGGHVRSPGEVQAVFASESHIDAIARELGRDPLEFRLAHAADDHVRAVLGEMRRIATAWAPPSAGDVGVGAAICVRDTGPGRSVVRLVATSGAGLDLFVATPDQGAGSFTAFRRVVATALGVPDEVVTVHGEGAVGGLEDSGAGASRVTAVTGGAVSNACEALLQSLGPPEGQVVSGVAGIDAGLARLGRTSIEVTGAWSSAAPPRPGERVRSYAGVVVEVAVDVETGSVQPRRAAVVADTGLVLNDVAHRGQLEGGFVFGLSQALTEELVVLDGQVVTASLGDYKLACIADVPPLEITVLSSRTGCVGSVGELVNIGVAPAIANAVDDAVGARVRRLPITAERVLAALHDKRNLSSRSSTRSSSS